MEKLAYLAKKMQSLHQERTALTQALASGKRTGNGDEVEVEVESVAQKALRVACSVPLYE